LVVAWSPRAVVEVVVGLWNVLGKLQDRLQFTAADKSYYIAIIDRRGLSELSASYQQLSDSYTHR
jgi:hypothetical protein